jgi:biopolymer transport protein ExbD
LKKEIFHSFKTLNGMMKQITFAAFLLTFCLFSCKETPKTTDNAATQAADTTANRGIEAMAAAPSTPPDSLIVEVDSMGKVKLGNRSIALDDLPKALVDSSNTLKKTTGQAPKTITYKSRGAMMGVRGAVQDAIEEAQDSLKKTKK